MTKRISFTPKAFEQYKEWHLLDKKVAKRLDNLIDEAARSPFSGTGKPEPLKHDLRGYWSRQLTQEDRLVYRVTEDDLQIISCKYHYLK